MWDFYQTALEPFSVFEHCVSQTSLISVTTWSMPRETPRPSSQTGPLGCLKPNILHVACKYCFMSLIFESSDRFSESVCIIDSIDVSPPRPPP